MRNILFALTLVNVPAASALASHDSNTAIRLDTSLRQVSSVPATWGAFVAFVEANAENYSSSSIEALKADLLSGSPTWILELTGPVNATESGKLGWPGTPNVIVFSSHADALYAANILEDVVISP
ncbi:MAG: hypothetical protein KDC26_04490 [Armatimonadetes bacterium]|nr:hypothetical protein [Armatimonadota bacterium]